MDSQCSLIGLSAAICSMPLTLRNSSASSVCPRTAYLTRRRLRPFAIEDKPGSLDAVRCDAGIIEIPGHPFVMSIMTTYLENNEDGERAIKQVARLVYVNG